MLKSIKQYGFIKWGILLYLILLISFSMKVMMEAADTPVSLSAPDTVNSGYLFPQVKVSIDRDPDAHRYRPQVAYNSVHQEYLVVWHNTWNTGERYVYARRLDLNGRPIGEPFALTTLLMDQMHPNVVYNPHNDVYFVVWQLDASGDNTRYEIYGSFIPWNATGPGTVFQIDDGEEAYNLYYPTVVWNSHYDEYLVIWDTYIEDGYPNSPYGIGYRRVAEDGQLSTGGWITMGNSPEGSDIVYNHAAAEYFVVYSRVVNDITQEVNIYGARLNRDVSFARSPYILSPEPADQINPAIATMGGNYGVVVQQWADSSGVWRQNLYFLDVDGDLVYSIGFDPPNGAKYPDIAVNELKEDWVWIYQTEAEAGSALYGYRFSYIFPSTLHFKASFHIYYLYWNTRTPAVAGGGPGFLVTYTGRSSYDPNSWQHIYASKYWQKGIFLPISLKNP